MQRRKWHIPIEKLLLVEMTEFFYEKYMKNLPTGKYKIYLGKMTSIFQLDKATSTITLITTRFTVTKDYKNIIFKMKEN